MGIDRLATAMAPAMGSHWRTRRLKKTSARPRRLGADVVPVDVDVAVVRARDRVHAQRDPHLLLVRERRDVAEALLLPERERAERRSERDGEGDRLAPASRERAAPRADAEEEERFDGFTSVAKPAGEPGEAAARGSRLSIARTVKTAEARSRTTVG